jgi:hypothetical protein
MLAPELEVVGGFSIASGVKVASMRTLEEYSPKPHLFLALRRKL